MYPPSVIPLMYVHHLLYSFLSHEIPQSISALLSGARVVGKPVAQLVGVTVVKTAFWHVTPPSFVGTIPATSIFREVYAISQSVSQSVYLNTDILRFSWQMSGHYLN
jgi:hypothetical protein